MKKKNDSSNKRNICSHKVQLASYEPRMEKYFNWNDPKLAEELFVSSLQQVVRIFKGSFQREKNEHKFTFGCWYRC